MIKSISKAIRIMRLFSAAAPRLSIGEISRQIAIPKSTTHSILKSLVAEGFVERCGGDYALGTALIALTQKVRVNVEVRDRAAPLVRALADRCEESVYLTVRDGPRVLYIYAVESSRRLIARTAIGDRGFMHSTGVGKAVLAQLSEMEIRAIATEVGLPRVTDRTITEIEEVLAEARRTRQRGYSVDDQENEIGNFCIGAAFLDCRGEPLGACSIAGTDEEILRSRAPALAAAVTSTCFEISRMLGWVPQSAAAARMAAAQ